MVPQSQPQVLYSAEQPVVETIKSAKDRLCGICAAHAGRFVRVETIDGLCYEGIIRHHEGCILYLEVVTPAHRAFWGPVVPYNPGFNSTILPLVLYELLVISLLA